MPEFTEEAKKQEKTFVAIKNSIQETESELLVNPAAYKTAEDLITKPVLDKDLLISKEEILNNKINAVAALMPEKLANKTDDDLPEKSQGMESFPSGLKRAVRALGAWNKVKAVSSQPVRDAARRLSESKTDAEGAKCMGELFSASITYLDMRVDQWHLWWGDGRRRIKQVKSFIEEAYQFSATAPALYYEKIGSSMDSFLRSSVEKPERYRRHVEKAEYMRDIKVKSLLKDEEESAHIRPESDLTKEKFNKLVDALTTTSGTGFDELKLGSEREAKQNKKHNAGILAAVKHNYREFTRGLALGYEIDADKISIAKVSVGVADYLMEHLTEAQDYKQVWEDIQAREVEREEKDFEKINHFYGITHSFSLTSDVMTAQKHFRELGYIDKFKKSPEYPEFCKKMEKNGHTGDLDDFIVMELCNKYNNSGSPEAYRTDMTPEEGNENYYYVELERRRAKGIVFSEAESAVARSAEIFRKNMDEATRTDNYDDIGSAAKNVISLNLQSIYEDYIKQPALIGSRVAEIKIITDYMPYITANAEKCGISPDELARLSATVSAIKAVEEKMSLETKLYAAGFIYMDENEAMDHLSVIGKYGSHTAKNADEAVAKEGEDITEFRLALIRKNKEVNFENYLQEEIVRKEDEIMAKGMKEVDTLTGFTGEDISYTPEQLEKRRSLRLSHITGMLKICKAYLKNEKSRNKNSKRYQRIKEHISRLESQRKYLTKGYTYAGGIEEVFDREETVLDETLKGLRGFFIEIGNSGNSIMTPEEFKNRQDVATASIREMLEKLKAQIELLEDTKDNEALRNKLMSIMEKRSRQMENLLNIDFNDYMNMFGVHFFTDFLEIASADNEKRSRMNTETKKAKSLAGEFGANKGELRKNDVSNAVEIEKAHSTYVSERKKTLPYEGRVQKLAGEIEAGKTVLTEEMITNLVSDINSQMTIDDIKDQYKVGGILISAALNVIGLGAEDTGIVMGFVQKFLEDTEFARSMGLKDEHMEAYNKFSAQCDDIMILSTRVYILENFLPWSLDINTSGMSKEQAESIEKQKKLYTDTITHMRYSINNLALQKFGFFCEEFFPFLMANGINAVMSKADGRQKDYISAVAAEEEKAVNTEGMNEKEAARAKLDYYEESLGNKYADPDLSSFAAHMRRRYYQNLAK